MSLQHSDREDRAEETWSILARLLKTQQTINVGPASASRCLILQQTLRFLNRRKERFSVVDDRAAYALIQELARELVAAGVELQNSQLICDALFCFVRSQEFSQKRMSELDVLRYQRALTFIDQHQGKTVLGIQVLLTRGSIHRHYCRNRLLPWF